MEGQCFTPNAVLESRDTISLFVPVVYIKTMGLVAKGVTTCLLQHQDMHACAPHACKITCVTEKEKGGESL